ncbi:glycoside hydrolase family 16 protein [Dactylonectria macrodidyma]|uniref:Glycoside hydrolase family 16 protein n=1 Tax=Dactylonectria macrodidyma TaxID=307937 RepID=A0A9P9DYQ2_9HYPO|nr:glycoside hydrolase family 16 protein [Dactylonectria macrodidyma]
MIWLFLWLISGVLLVSSRCECGYTSKAQGSDVPMVFMDLLETDFTRIKDLSENPGWVRQQFNVSAENGRGAYGKAFTPSNIITLSMDGEAGSGRRPGLGLRVGSAIQDDAVPVAEIDTARRDLHWGSYRAGMKLTATNGTCAAFFWYFNDTQEIDMEFLSREFDSGKGVYPMNLVIQSKQSQEAGFDASKTGTFRRVNLDFDPTAGFHEYRFDYTPGLVIFYTDSKQVAVMDGSEMPSAAGHLILQHWSNGNPKWSGGPPAKDAMLTVSYVKAYFNSSDEQGHATLTDKCHEAGTNGTACLIPDVMAINASTGGAFLSDEGNVLGKGTGDGEENTGGRHFSPAWLLVAVMAILWME